MSISSSEDEGMERFHIEEESNEERRLFGGKSSNRTTMKIFGIFAAVAVVVLIIVLPVYFAVIEPDDVVVIPDVIPDDEKFDCYPEGGANQITCEERGCTWEPNSNPSVPTCIFTGPPSYSLDGAVATDDDGMKSTLRLAENAPDHYGKQFAKLVVETTYVSSSTLRIKITPSDGKRYEVPIEHKNATQLPSDAQYKTEHITSDVNFGVKITRKATNTVLFDTSVGQMIFADQFLSISTKVASEYIYGFGEHMHDTFKHDMNWKRYGMFTRDKGVEAGYNLYGMHPYFMCMEGDGNAYGVFFVNSNAMEVELQPMPAVTYRTVGGILDFYIFLGPSPEDVTSQYTDVVGQPYFPPYWSLGFQLCRWGYENLTNLDTVVQRNLDSGIPYDVQYTDIDYMERQMDFTIDNETYFGLEEYVTELKEKNNMRYIIILDPAIPGNETSGSYPPFDNGITDGVFIKTPQGEIAWGKVWPDLPGIEIDTSKPREYQIENYRAYTAFPDFFLPNTSRWWKNLTVEFHNRLEYDGLWIDMNEPTSFVDGSPNGCPNSKFESPPYLPIITDGEIYDDTICMQNLQYHPKTKNNTEHYNLHSLYGWSQTLPTLEACREATGKRCMIISRSTYPGAGKYAGHWLGDNKSTWEHLAASIIGMFEFNLFGFPYVGADVCGFFENSNKDLCRRWMQIGAFYPFFRNHNEKGTKDQDPAVYGDEFLTDVKYAMETRYKLLPYLYTLFYDSHVSGSTVVRPLMNEFPKDSKTYTADTQFLWGSGLLITPVITEDDVTVSGYFPEARWFDYSTGTELSEVGEVELDAPLNYINLHLHGGNIIPVQGANKTTFHSRQNPFGLIVALDEAEEANGKLFWDDGESIGTIESQNFTLLTFSCKKGELNISVTQQAPVDLDVSHLYFDKILVYGVKNSYIDSVTVDEDTESEGSGSGTTTTDESFMYLFNDTSHVLEIFEIKLFIRTNHTITWVG